MLYKILNVWLCFSLCSIAFAQDSFQIKGSVVNANTLLPVVGANIIGNGIFSISTDSGEFTLKKVHKDTYTLSISHIGYTTQTIIVKANPKMEALSIFLDTATTDLDEIEVHGKTKKRYAQELATVSYAVSKEFLDKNRENSLMQTLKKIPGVSTINIGSGQSKPVIRGLGFNRVVVVQNGIKHEAQQWGNDHGLEIDQYGIENIRIIKGAASLVYGSDAIAGVVDIQASKAPLPNTLSGEVNLLGESNNNLWGVSAGIQARKEKWFYKGRLTYRRYGDYKVPTDRINYENYVFELDDNNLRNTAGKEANASFSIGYVSENIKSETFFSNVNAKNGFFANAHGLEVRTSTIDYDRSNRDIDLPFHKVNHFKITNNTSINSGSSKFYIDLGYQNNFREEYSEPVPHGYMPTPPNSKERVFNKNTYSLNFRGAFKPNKKHDVTAGINLEYQDNNIGGWGFLIPEYNRFSIGAFVYDKLEITPNLFLLGGIRYSYGSMLSKSYYDWYPSNSIYVQRAQNKSLYFDNISAAIGLSYIQKNTTYKINLGRSFRMPLANELTSDGVNYHMYRYEKGNLNLDPETAYELDLEVDYVVKNFSLNISPFVNYFTNYIYLNPTANYYETLQIYEYTQSKVFRFGGEISAGISINKNLQLTASAEYVYARQTSGPKKDFTLPFSPPLSGLFSVNYQFNDFYFLKTPQLFADYRVTAAQNEIVPPEEKTAGYEVLQLSFISEIQLFKNKPLAQMRLKLNNVFNTKYYDHTSFYRLIDVPEAGRNLSMSLTIPF